MIEIRKEQGGELLFDESMNRLILNITDSKEETFNKLSDQVTDTIEKHHVSDFLIDASNRKTADVDDLDYAEKHIKRILKEGLEKMAIVMNRDTFQSDLATTFISNIASNSVQGFFDREKAIQWLDSERTQLRRAS